MVFSEVFLSFQTVFGCCSLLGLASIWVAWVFDWALDICSGSGPIFAAEFLFFQACC